MTRDELNRLVEERIFGDDLTATTERRVEDALEYAFYWLTGRDIELLESRGARAGHGGLFGIMDVWRHRDGLTVQEHIESHVSAWRADPRDFCGDIGTAWLVVEQVKNLKSRFGDGCDVRFGSCQCVNKYGVQWHAEFETPEACYRGVHLYPSVAIVLAALRAKGVTIEGEVE